MKLTRCKKIVLAIIFVVFTVLLFNSDTVLAAVNTEYSGTDSVPDTALEDAFEDSTLLELLAKLIYAVGRFLEWILGTIFRLLTGSSDFPWADKIVFNAVPLLDVNFINPGAGSFVAQSAIQGVLKNLYATILTLAVAFFGIVVLITAIKLVISTIASEKAKYKQAIVDWLVGFVMLFCIHYFISFIFYLNEQLVTVASKIVISQLNVTNAVAQVQADKLADDLIKDVKDRGLTSVAKTLEDNPVILSTWMNALSSKDSSKGLQEGLMKKRAWYAFGADVAKNTDTQYKNLGLIISWAAAENVSVQELAEIKRDIKVFRIIAASGNGQYAYNQAISRDNLKKIFGSKYSDFVTAMELKSGDWSTDWATASKVSGDDILISWDSKGSFYWLSRGSSVLGNYKTGYTYDESDFYWTSVLDDLITLKGASNTSSGTYVGGTAVKTRLISDLATYFRYNSYSKELRSTNVTGVKNGDNIQIQNMIMYAILVAQSLILFVSYVKRLFYVILLAMIGPVVVVFDFFQKFGK